MEQELGEFMLSGFFDTKQSHLLRETVLQLLKEIRPNAVSLVDAFHLPDFYLNSALGRYDGKVYETMCEWAEREPLNQVTLDVNIESDVLFREEDLTLSSNVNRARL